MLVKGITLAGDPRACQNRQLQLQTTANCMYSATSPDGYEAGFFF